MAHFLMVQGKVKDFKTWKPAYDAHISVRKEFGLSDEQVFQSADDPNEFVVVLKAADLNRAKAFMADPKIQEVISKSGVIGTPHVHFLEKA
jgi:hypothetical protein